MNTNMTQKALWRALIYSSICLTAFLLVIFIPIIANAQVPVNNAPIITSNPTLVVTTDQAYQYAITATDSDNDPISYKLTNSPKGLIINDNIITWNPKTIGTYNVVIEASDGNNGYDNQSWQITVEPGEVASITVTPNNKPTIINLGSNQQFTVIAYDASGNIISNPIVKWSSDGNFTSVDNNGLVTGNIPGIGWVSASIGNLESAPGIIVNDNRTTPIAKTEDSTTNVDSSSPEETISTNNPENSNEESSSEITDATEIIPLENNVEENKDEDKEDESCVNIAHNLTFILLIIYALILAIYYIYEKKHKSSSWWIFPLLVTFIGLIVYYRYFCPQTYLWWPWILVVIGVVTTGYYKGRSGTPTKNNPENELPF